MTNTTQTAASKARMSNKQNSARQRRLGAALMRFLLAHEDMMPGVRLRARRLLTAAERNGGKPVPRGFNSQRFTGRHGVLPKDFYGIPEYDQRMHLAGIPEVEQGAQRGQA